MNVRVLVVALVLATVGAACGYAVGEGWTDEPAAMRSADPVPGRAPSFPSDPVIEVLPDPGTPALAPALDLHDERVGSRAFGVRAPVPDGWLRTDTDLVESKWAPPGLPLNTYLLRVKIVSGLRLTVAQALEQRLDALASVVSDFRVESRTADTFVASYVYENYRRLALERFVSLDGTDAAFVTIAAIGRLRDRAGLSDLLERVTSGVARLGS